jgi:6-phosphogluconate dehydrogenase
VHGCKGSDWRIRPARPLSVLAALDADCIALQEFVDTPLVPGASLLQDWAAALDMHAVYAPAFERGGEVFGNALLSRHPIASWDQRTCNVPGYRDRVLLDARLTPDGVPVRIVVVHLGVNPLERARMADEIGALIDTADDQPQIWVGDFNEWQLRAPLLRRSRPMRRCSRSTASGYGPPTPWYGSPWFARPRPARHPTICRCLRKSNCPFDLTQPRGRGVACYLLGAVYRLKETAMKLGMIGLGRMGGNMARRLRRGGIDVVGFAKNAAHTRELASETGMTSVASVEALVAEIAPPRLIWLMLPAGDVTEQYVSTLRELLQPGDVIIDGANSHFKDSIRRAESLAERRIGFVDAGVSGGVWGLEEGYALMVGGRPDSVARIEPALRVLAPGPDTGWLHCGPSGSGHFVKMVHNGIEYGMMQAYAEGFALLEARRDFDLDLAAIAEMWRHGSVVRSWLLDLTARFLATDQTLADVAAQVDDSGEGRWTVVEAIEQGVPAPVIATSLMMRFASQGHGDYANKTLAMMRNSFGGHFLHPAEKE